MFESFDPARTSLFIAASFLVNLLPPPSLIAASALAFKRGLWLRVVILREVPPLPECHIFHWPLLAIESLHSCTPIRSIAHSPVSLKNTSTPDPFRS